MRSPRMEAFAVLVFAASAAAFMSSWPVSGARAADAAATLSREAASAPPPPVALRAAFLSETRIGVMAGAPWSDSAASPALQGEILFGKPFSPADLFVSYFVPRPHFGAALDFDGGANYAFAGFTWSVDVAPRVFLEASLGGAIHDGAARAFAQGRGAALGCSPVFRETASIGYRLTERVTVTATIERYGDRGLCDAPVGAPASRTNVGARIGYAF